MFEYKATVENVVDGDTVDALIDLGFKVYIKQRLRLSGLDTPERGQPGYAEAKAFVTEKVLGKVVSIKTEKVSKWGYFLAEITVDGVSLNTQLLSSGLAKAYDGGKKE